ncbi:hypothetical protein NY63_22335 [Xanthomonas citri pv. fuscans]|nr:hypothetical protein NY63_22335 [Xanthomonas citri pv. fuscans]
MVTLLNSNILRQTDSSFLIEALHTDQLDWSLPAHRRGTLGGMDAAKELTRTYLQLSLINNSEPTRPAETS